jgi:hypothetical protein
MQKPAPATLQPLACTLVQFRTILYPCSRTSANTLVQSGELETFLHNGRRMVLLKKAREFVKRRATAGGAIPPKVSAQKSAAGKKGRALQLDASG